MRRVIVMGAAGRDFPDFNVAYRDDPETEVVAFTDDVVFAYSERLPRVREHQASRVMAAGASFVLLGPDATMPPTAG